MSRGKRIQLAISFFILLPGLIAYITKEPESRNQIVVVKKTSTPSPSKSSCFDIRAERNRLDNVNDKNREEAIAEINALQKEFLLNKLQGFSTKGLITADEFGQIKEISEGTLQESTDSFVENSLDVSAILDRLIKNKHLRPYFENEVITLGERLASSSNPTFAFIIANRNCFDELDIMMAESFTSIDTKPIESGWGKKKNGADFVSVLIKG